MQAVGMTVTKTLFALSGNTCYFDRCEQRLTDPSWSHVMAEIAHIHGFRPGSARYDRTIDADQVHAFENLMLMCRNHHAEIDDLNPDDYPVDVLRAMKQRHESRVDDWASEDQLAGFARLALVQLAQTNDAPPTDTMTDEEELDLFKSIAESLNSAERTHVLDPQLQTSFYAPWQINEAPHADKKPTYLNRLSDGIIEWSADRDDKSFEFTERGRRFLEYLRSTEHEQPSPD